LTQTLHGVATQPLKLIGACDMKVKKLKPLDAVWTKFKTLAVVAEVSASGQVSLVLPEGSMQKVAWYSPSELEYIGPVSHLVAGIKEEIK